MPLSHVSEMLETSRSAVCTDRYFVRLLFESLYSGRVFSGSIFAVMKRSPTGYAVQLNEIFADSLIVRL